MNRFFPPSRPRAVEGGIKARSQRGAIAQTWWSERFIAVLEDIGMGNRLQRGRGYARQGRQCQAAHDATVGFNPAGVRPWTAPGVSVVTRSATPAP